MIKNVILTKHSKERLSQRQIKLKDVKKVLEKGTIVNNSRDAIVKKGTSGEGKKLKVVYNKEKKNIIVITAYYED